MTATLRRLVARVMGWLRPGRAERELDREVTAHLALIEDAYLQRGWSPAGVRAAARRDLGGVDQAKERHRDQCSLPWLEDLTRDVSYALLGWRRHPGFTLTAVVTIALGVGVSTAIGRADDVSDPVRSPIAESRLSSAGA